MEGNSNTGYRASQNFHILTADSPEELGQMIGDDFGTATPGSLAHQDRITEPWT